jgi:hypothetical protein
MHTLIRTALLSFMIVLIAACGSPQTSQKLTAEEVREIASKAYVYGFPMVVAYKTLYNYAIDDASPEYKSELNQIWCDARVFTPADRAIVTPNSDTPYCMNWMDLRAEPLVLTVPEMESGRFYHVQFIDLYTHNYAYVGTLSTGDEAGSYLIAGPDWSGQQPEGINGVLRSETEFVFQITRTQLFNPDDLTRVKEIQQGYKLQSLSEYSGTATPQSLSVPNFPVWVEGAQFDERFFVYLDFIMSLLQKPGEGEQSLWGELAKLGIGTGEDFDFDSLSPELQAALREGIQDGFADIEKIIQETANDPLGSAKVFGTREFLTTSAKTNFGLESPDLIRAAAAHIGLFGNSAAEAIYPAYLVGEDGQPLDTSSGSYTLTFAADALPPVDSFWSLTMYAGKTQLLIENPLDRYLVNSSMLEQFTMEADGSLVFYISKGSPGQELEANWLPAPDGPFYMVLRLYGPKAEALEGKWMPPAIIRQD